ncbi:hypothetical protein A8C32_06835 [Flavivirga aquatica]|uniref:Thioredoxin domain-containing protein n=2 Tax=Flavivirga aquatica TaxID=1849968 RepID=A0A1E5SIF3_9FLAO|nr:hypothetical protein A8C32_06835 [Flavivirga aquatica]
MCFLFPLFFFGQIKVSQHIQASKITKQNNNALYFVDFWATWCSPCVHVSKYLESLQKQYSDNFYVLSLTKESPEVVKRFMEKRNMDLAVAIDYEGETFANNKVVSLPYGILYNAQGVKLWEGHPAEFKGHHIEGFLKDNKKRISVDDVFITKLYSKEVEKEEVSLKDDFEILEIDENVKILQIKKHKFFLELKGHLKDILAYSYNVHKRQIVLSGNLNKNYKVKFNFETNAYKNKAKFIIEALKLKQVNKEITGKTLVFNIEEPTFWDTKQIDWGVDTRHFLIGDSEIKADNVTLSQIKYQLTNLLNIPIIIKGNKTDEDLHDWEIHYKYFGLMKSIMDDTYGIQIEKKIANFPNYIITQR